MDPIKEAFSRIKEDISLLREELAAIRSQLSDIQSIQTTPTHNPTHTPQHSDTQTLRQTSPTHNQPLESPCSPNMPVSIGNGGVPTDRQTDRQTDQHVDNSSHNPQKEPYNINQTDYLNTHPIDPISEFRRANEVLSSLDSIKKEIRLKFKALTPQEMLVFNTLYDLEDQSISEITYKLLANNLRLSESSVRDYINKLIHKGVPIDKIRQNNKTIVLKISQDLKNVATLDTIIRLREI